MIKATRAYLIIISFLFLKANSQNFAWADNWGANATTEPYAISVDASGNVITVGIFRGTADFDPGPGSYTLASTFSNSNFDIFVSKLDASGNFIWAKQIGGGLTDNYAASVKTDAANNIYFTGHVCSGVDMDPGAGTYTWSVGSGKNIFVSKLDSNGNFIWAKQFVSTGGSWGRGNAITIDNAGNVYSTGFFDGVTDFDPGPGTYTVAVVGMRDIYISKLDSAGNFVWAKVFPGAGYLNGSGIAVDALGSVYTTGTFQNATDFDPGPGVYNLLTLNDCAYISKLDAFGNFIWAKQFAQYSFGTSIKIDKNSNVYTTGSFSGLVDFDPGAGTYTLNSVAGYDIFISKLDGSGNFLWAKTMGGSFGDYGKSLDLDPLGNVYTTGIYSSNVDFDPGPGTFSLSNTAGSQATYVSKLDSSGNFVWANQIGGQSGTFVEGEGICLDTYGAIYLTGDFGGKIDFNPGAGVYDLADTLGGIAYALKLDCLYPTLSIACTSSLLCSGSPCTITVGGGVIYSWSTGSSSSSITVNPSVDTIYSVIGTDSTGCSNKTTQLIMVNPLPLINVVTSDTVLCVGETTTLSATGANSYTWSTGSNLNNTIVSPTVTTTYTINGTDNNNCTSMAVFTQSVSACIGILEFSLENPTIKIYPNPNNGNFTIESESESTLLISNELGQKIQQLNLNASNNYKVLVNSLNGGVYFITSANCRVNKKIVVK